MHWNAIFVCVIHGPQNCMKWMKNAFRCWTLCFHMIVWCFNPVDTTHLFLWEKIAPFGCSVMAILWVQTNGSTSLRPIRLDIFLTLKGIEWRLKIWFLMAKYTRCCQKTKQCQNSIVKDENACFQVYWNCLKKCFACKLNCLKQSLIWCHFHSTRMTTE